MSEQHSIPHELAGANALAVIALPQKPQGVLCHVYVEDWSDRVLSNQSSESSDMVCIRPSKDSGPELRSSVPNSSIFISPETAVFRAVETALKTLLGFLEDMPGFRESLPNDSVRGKFGAFVSSLSFAYTAINPVARASHVQLLGMSEVANEAMSFLAAVGRASAEARVRLFDEAPAVYDRLHQKVREIQRIASEMCEKYEAANFVDAPPEHVDVAQQLKG